jgi:hypothetical protein
MRKEYDFTNAKPNPYIKNLYLTDCAVHSKNINIAWK